LRKQQVALALEGSVNFIINNPATKSNKKLQKRLCIFQQKFALFLKLFLIFFEFSIYKNSKI